MSRKAALLIGCDRYDDLGFPPLTSPSVDVKDLARVLSSQSIGAFDDVQMMVNQSSSTVRRTIAEFFHDRGPDDLLLLYFSGHGYLTEGRRLVLALRDTERLLARATGIDAAFMSDEMDRCRSRRQVLILDCCHSGAFVGGKGADDLDAQVEEALRGNGYGRYVLAASDVTERAWETPKHRSSGRSVFTHHIIDGLASWRADDDHDGLITVDDIYRYTEAAMLAAPDAARPQTPRKWLYEQKRGDVVIASRPGVKVLPREIRVGLAHPWEETRISAIARLLRLVGDGDAELAAAARSEFQRLNLNDPIPSVREAAAEALSGDKDALTERMVHSSDGASGVRPRALTIDVDGPVSLPAGSAMRASVTIRNGGTIPIDYLTVLHERTLLEAPFELGAGQQRVLHLNVTIGAAGEHHHEVRASGVGSDGRLEYAGVRFTVTAVRAEEEPLTAAVKTTTREDLKQLARNHGPDDVLTCPRCQAKVKARNLVRHVDRKHGAGPVRTVIRPEDRTHRGLEAKRTRPPPLSRLRRSTEAGMPAGQQLDVSPGALSPAERPHVPPAGPGWSREQIKSLARSSPPDRYLVCPMCNVQVKARRLVQHFDREHTEHNADVDTRTQTRFFDTRRGEIWALARTEAPDEYLRCPVCLVQVKAKRLVEHHDRWHAVR